MFGRSGGGLCEKPEEAKLPPMSSKGRTKRFIVESRVPQRCERPVLQMPVAAIASFALSMRNRCEVRVFSIFQRPAFSPAERGLKWSDFFLVGLVCFYRLFLFLRRSRAISCLGLWFEVLVGVAGCSDHPFADILSLVLLE